MAEVIFSGLLGEIVAGLSAAVEATDEAYKGEVRNAFNNVSLPRLQRRQEALVNNPLGKLYREWRFDLDGENAWGKFVTLYQEVKAASPDGQVRAEEYPGIIGVNLPGINSYEGDGRYDGEKMQANMPIQTRFARALGVLANSEGWGDFLMRSYRLVGVNDYKGTTCAS